MSDIDLDVIQKRVENGEFPDAVTAVITELFFVITKQEVALRRVVAALAEDSDLRKRVEGDGVMAHIHGAGDYQGTTLQDVLEWAKMGLEPR